MIYLFIFLAAFGGYFIGRCTSRGRWVKVEKPKTHQDRAHLWVRLDGADRAFTAEQLQVAADRATYMSGRSDYYPPNF
jgi:hypothetical protein